MKTIPEKPVPGQPFALEVVPGVWNVHDVDAEGWFAGHLATGVSEQVARLVLYGGAAVEACRWIGQFVLTASDGGDAWCAVRNQRGAQEWFQTLKAAVANFPQPGG